MATKEKTKSSRSRSASKREKTTSKRTESPKAKSGGNATSPRKDEAGGQSKKEQAELIESASTDQSVYNFPEGATPSELFPQRRAMDIDIKDVDPGNGKGEHLPPLNAETFVILDGDHEDVPDEYDGKVAAVINWPRGVKHDEETGETYEFLPPKGSYEVKELSQGAKFFLPLDAFKQVSTNGRAGLVGFA